MTEDGKPLKDVTIKSGKLYYKPVNNPNAASDEWVEIPAKGVSIIKGMSINYEAPGIWLDESHSMKETTYPYTLSDVNQALEKLKKNVNKTTEAVEIFYNNYYSNPYYYDSDIQHKEFIKKVKEKSKLKPTTDTLW